MICFCDSNESLNGKYIEDIPVRLLGNACQVYLDVDYLISGRYVKEIYQILREKLFEKIDILLFSEKTKFCGLQFEWNFGGRVYKWKI